MKNLIIMLMMALFFNGSLVMAKPYCLYDNIGQQTHHGSRIPKRSLYVDLTDNILVVPNQLLGFTLTLTGDSGMEYCCLVTDNKIIIPKYIKGEFLLQVTNGQVTYSGHLNY